MVIFFALLAALANALASVCQRLGVEDAPSNKGPSLGLIRHMLTRRVWLVGFVIMAGGYAAQAIALHLGSLNLVQPLMVSELVILVLVLWLWYFTPLRPRDLVGAGATAVGLAAFLAVAWPTSGTRVPGDGLWLVTGVIIVAVVLVFVMLGRSGPGWRRALLLGTGVSSGFALLAAITKSFTDVAVAHGGGLFASWQLYAICVVGLGAFLIMQNAFQVGPFAASQSALILVNPFVSLLVGYVLYGERLRGGPLNVTFEVLALLVMVGGAVVVSTSPLIASVHDETGAEHLLQGRGRYARWVRRRAHATTP